MSIDSIREYIVVVNGGTGCIFQPLDNTYSYVLTAKHNIVNAGNQITDLVRFSFNDGNWSERPIEIGELIKDSNYFPHPEKDIAILKVNKIGGLDKLIRKTDLNTDRENYILVGYPEARRLANPNNKINWFRPDDNVRLHGTNDNNLREAQVPNNASIGEIRGHSGGGIVKIQDDYILLAGIQNRMAVARGEQLGRVEFSPLDSFDEIIAQYPEQLASIAPPYMKCFSFLQEDAFNLDAGFSQDDVEFTIGFLKSRTKQVVDSPTTPNAIKEYFEKRLLINNQSEEILQTRAIWLTWLEFLTILNIVKESIFDKEALFDIFNSYRLLYSSTKGDWSTEVHNMVYSDYKGLKKDGVVIIGVEKPPFDETYVISKTIPQITKARRSQNRDKLNIDDGISFPFDNYTFVHIDYFKGKTIVKKHAEFREIIDDNILLNKLKDEYDELFRA